MDPRSEPVVSHIETSSTPPSYLFGSSDNPSGSTEVSEKAYLVSELQTLFGSPTSGGGSVTPVDGTTKPDVLNVAASNTSPYIYLNTSTGVTWIYNPAQDKWHGEVTVEVAIPGNAVTSYDLASFPDGFNSSHLRNVMVERVAGVEELGINHIDRSTTGVVKIYFRGRQVQAGNYKLLITYKK